MTRLYAYDFDKTLIPYDSFNRFLRELMRKRPVRVGWILLWRMLRVYSATAMKQRINDLVMSDVKCVMYAKLFAKQIAADVRWPRQPHGTTIILSASPICYIQYLADELHCQIAASSWIDGRFVNMYGEEKLLYLQKHYPTTEYEWHYAASDSKSDLCWMERFAVSEMVNV